MHDELGDVTLAGVAHANPHCHPGWKGFFAVLVVIAGGALVLAGVSAGFTARRGAERPREQGTDNGAVGKGAGWLTADVMGTALNRGVYAAGSRSEADVQDPAKDE